MYSSFLVPALPSLDSYNNQSASLRRSGFGNPRIVSLPTYAGPSSSQTFSNTFPHWYIHTLASLSYSGDKHLKPSQRARAILPEDFDSETTAETITVDEDPTTINESSPLSVEQQKTIRDWALVMETKKMRAFRIEQDIKMGAWMG